MFIHTVNIYKNLTLLHSDRMVVNVILLKDIRAFKLAQFFSILLSTYSLLLQS